MQMTRRSFTLGLAASAALARRPASALTVRGVRLGVQTYSFHYLRQGGLPAVEQISAAMKRLNLNICELFSPDVQPARLCRAARYPALDGLLRHISL
jgi:hypothetical protein